jgi:hypothetical protein
MTIQKIFKEQIDEEVHSSFLKYGRGEYKNKFLLEAKKQTKGYTIKTGPEYVNYLVKKCLEKANEKTHITGIIVSTTDLREEIPFEIKKASNFQGIRKFQIDTEITKEDITNIIEKHPRAFYALSFKGEDFQIKTKAKAPTSGKPGKESDEGPKADFTTLKTSDETIIKELFFDINEFKETKINHTIHITDIIYPKGYETMKPTEIREQSKRKGTIKRNITTDGKTTTTEKEFVA